MLIFKINFKNKKNIILIYFQVKNILRNIYKINFKQSHETFIPSCDYLNQQVKLAGECKNFQAFFNTHTPTQPF